MQTIGISPKVKLPAWALTVIGVLLLVLGYVLGDDNLRTVGYALIGGGPLAGALGYVAAPGPVAAVADPSSIAPDEGDAGVPHA